MILYSPMEVSKENGTKPHLAVKTGKNIRTMGRFLCFIYGFYFAWNDASATSFAPPVRSASFHFVPLHPSAIESLNPECANIPTPHSAVGDG